MQSAINFTPPGPIAKAFMEDDAFVRFLIGPLGSGKTSTGIVEMLRRAALQAPGPDGKRRTRWAVVRNTFSDLRTTTLKSFQDWAPPAYGKLTLGSSPIVHRIQAGDLDTEILFLPLDKEADIRKLLSLELTGALIDECRQIPMEILRNLIPRIGRFPAQRDGGCTWSGIMCISNPSDVESELYKVVQNPPSRWKVYTQPSARSPEAENLMNLHPDYYPRLMDGQPEDWIRCYVDAEFVFVIDGQVVYSAFRDATHVAPQRLPPIPGLPLAIGADWGLTPCAVIAQQMPNGQIVVIDEVITDNTGIVRFAEMLTAYVARTYPGYEVAVASGDPAGTARGHDEKTAFQIMRQHSPWDWRPAPTNEVTLRLEVVTAALNRMMDGMPGFLLSPNCSLLRAGFNGGYNYQRVATANGTMFHQTPSKNKFSHVQDALQYLVLSIGGADAVLNRNSRRWAARPRFAEGMDYDILEDYSAPPVGPRTICGNGRPAHIDRNRRRPVYASGFD